MAKFHQGSVGKPSLDRVVGEGDSVEICQARAGNVFVKNDDADFTIISREKDSRLISAPDDEPVVIRQGGDD